MSTWPNRGASGGPCGGWNNESSNSPREVRPCRSDSSQQASSKAGAVQTAYRVSFYDREYGDLEDVVTLGSFEAGAQLVCDRLSADGHYLITATWANHQGEMTVSTPRQMVLARIEVADDRLPQVQPPVLKAWSALQAGDTSSIAHLFEHLPEAA